MNMKQVVAASCVVLGIGALLPEAASADAMDYAGASSGDVTDWAGPYVGVHAGYAQDKNVTLDFPGSSSGSFDMTGAMGGLQVGYNVASGGVVAGLEANATAADVTGNASCPGGAGKCEATMDQLYSLQGHVGVPIKNFLLYGSLGAASGQIEAKNPTSSDTKFQTGWLVGLGGAMAFSKQWNGLLELQYIDFGSNNYNLGGNTVSVENRFLTLNLGANWKF